MSPFTLALAGAGNAEPAYFDTTSTTCRMVCTTSCFTVVSCFNCDGLNDEEDVDDAEADVEDDREWARVGGSDGAGEGLLEGGNV
jgi:hypothetical protein